tara:strand:- start:552 stop:950 length:399 start_codon:yes stop_codon:yes gene_type:complete
MKIDGLIKNIPNQVYDDDYVLTNSICFMLAKKEYSFVKHLRKKTLAGEISDQSDLEKNINNELKNHDGGELLGMQFMLGQVLEMLATRLNDFDKNNNNKFNGYIELEQYHTITGIIIKMLPELIVNQLTKEK